MGLPRIVLAWKALCFCFLQVNSCLPLNTQNTDRHFVPETVSVDLQNKGNVTKKSKQAAFGTFGM